jgi:nicotinamidase-related amidase
MQEFYRAKGFGHPIGFGENPAVLVVDFIDGFTNPESPLGSNLDREVEATARLLAGARSRHIPIVFITTSYDFDDFRDAGWWRVKESGVKSLKTASPAVEIDPRLNWNRNNEHCINKKFASAFFGTDLLSRLNATSVDTLLVTGCATSGCVRATTVDGLQNGYRTMVVREAVGDRSLESHTQSLVEIDAKYGDVVSLEESLEYLAKLPSQPSDQ